MMKQKINDILADVSGVDAGSILETTRLVDDLGLTSFDLADIIVNIEDEYGVSIPDEELQSLQTVGNVYELAGRVLKNED